MMLIVLHKIFIDPSNLNTNLIKFLETKVGKIKPNLNALAKFRNDPPSRHTGTSTDSRRKYTINRRMSITLMDLCTY